MKLECDRHSSMHLKDLRGHNLELKKEQTPNQ